MTPETECEYEISDTRGGFRKVHGYRVGDFAVRRNNGGLVQVMDGRVFVLHPWSVDHIPARVSVIDAPTAALASFVADELAIHMDGAATAGELDLRMRSFDPWIAYLQSHDEPIKYRHWLAQQERADG